MFSNKNTKGLEELKETDEWADGDIGGESQ
jgi:hypothetical protein